MVTALTRFQGWVRDGLVDNKAADDSNFLQKRAPISWVGHWMYKQYHDVAGDDLVVLPLPNFGKGSKTGMGSWAWSMTRSAADPDAAWAVIEFLMSDQVIGEITTANGAVPATKSAVAKSPLFASGGDLALFADQLGAAPNVAVPRPVTPAYPTITQSLRAAIDDIVQGGDVKKALDDAVKQIDDDIKANDGYPAPKS